jgi:hypothetical protein
MKKLIEVDRPMWARVKYFATIKNMTLRSALELLISQALDHSGVFTHNEEQRSET